MPPHRIDVSASATRAFLLGGILLCLALQAWLALVVEVNWDEFYYLSHIYGFQRGDLTIAPQTGHVQLFGWLTAVAGGEVRQIEVGRLVMLAAESVTCALLYVLSRTFFDRTPSLLAVLAYVSAGFTMIHGASFRADPLAAMLTMAALVILARAKLTFATSVACALFAAVALMITAKAVLYAPAFAGVAAWRWWSEGNRKRLIVWIVATSLAAGALFASLYMAHLSTLPSASASGSQAIISGAARKTLFESGLVPRVLEISRAAILSPIQTLLVLIGAGTASGTLIRSRAYRTHGAAALACGATLLCLLFYRNAFLYFFAFIFPPASLLIAFAIQHSFRSRTQVLLIGAAMTMIAVAVAVRWTSYDHRWQEQLVSVVHRMFPQPVPYIDRGGMIASFPMRGFFMSTWGMQDYRSRGRPGFDDLLARETVPLLIINGPAIEQMAGQREEFRLGLLTQDQASLLCNFIPHWGAIWVAGQTHDVGPAATEIAIRVPGIYTIEGASVAIDGRLIAEGSTASLSRGQHRLSSPGPARVTLRWGDRLWRPREPAPLRRVFLGFWPMTASASVPPPSSAGRTPQQCRGRAGSAPAPRSPLRR